MRVLISSLVALAIGPTIANAQASRAEAIPVPVAQVTQENRLQTTTGPTIESAAVGIRPTVSDEAAASTQSRQRRRSGVGNDVALMIVGGAAMVAGAVIDGDAGTIFLVGGAVIALWGLYNYLQ
jgi:hypothetical protein